MTDAELIPALDRAERALARIERSVSEARLSRQREEQLRARVREAVAELDSLIEGVS